MPKKRKLPTKLTPANRYDISMIGESIAEGGCGVFVESYAQANKGHFIIGVEAGGGVRYYDVKVKPNERYQKEFGDDGSI